VVALVGLVAGAAPGTVDVLLLCRLSVKLNMDYVIPINYKKANGADSQYVNNN
jgi:hypothetical protein